MRWWRNERGQHSTEFALVIGIAALVAIGMQTICERAMRSGVQLVSDVTLGPPEEEDETTVELDIQTQQSADVEGDPRFVRTTQASDELLGHAVNEDCQVTVPAGVGVGVGGRGSC